MQPRTRGAPSTGKTENRLVKLCGMLASDQAAERAAAGLKADQLVRRNGFQCGDVIQIGAPKRMRRFWRQPHGLDQQAARICLDWPEALTSWELHFPHSLMAWRGRLTPSRRRVLLSIVRKCGAYAAWEYYFGSAALQYAAFGWRILPVWPGTKKGMVPYIEASRNPEQISAWLAQHPDANWAVALGPGSGIVALDCEGPEGERTIAQLEHEQGPLPELWPCVWSGSGKRWHGYFAAPAGPIRNRSLGTELEFRGDKLLLTLPPSLHPSGRRYRWNPDRHPGIMPPPPLPAAWLKLVAPEPEPERAEWRPGRRRDGSTSYVAKALESELALVAVVPKGRRNQQLNASAHALFRFSADERLDPDIAVDGLLAAARHAGLLGSEAMATIRSAARARGVAL